MVYPAKKHLLKTLEKLVELLPAADQTRPQIVFLAGSVTPFRDDTDRELTFRQESNFYYLSGCTVPSSYLLVAYKQGTSLEKMPSHDLFIPRIDPEDLIWSLPPPTPEAAAGTHDVTRVELTDDLPDTLQEMVKAFPNAMFHTLPKESRLFPSIPTKYTGLVVSGKLCLTDHYLLHALHKARLLKTSEELHEIRKANEISSRAHETVMRVLGLAIRGAIIRGEGAGDVRPLLPSEWLIEKESEAEAIFTASCRREGSIHQAYLPIVAASTRASTLHYCCNDREFSWGPVNPHDHKNVNVFGYDNDRQLNPQVLLIDAGCEWNCYASDITRTMPVGNGGKFTSEAKAIYELVHEMQRRSFESLRPGVHWDDVHLQCHRTLVREFQRLGIFKTPESDGGSGSWNSEDSILASGISIAFFPHGLGHSLGLDVHDVPSASKPATNDTIGKESAPPEFFKWLRLRLPLEVGMVVTVEPGIYFSPHLLAPVRDSRHINHDVLKRYENVGGVRIEDVVVITETGYENFTKVRSDVEWIEGVCSGQL